MPARYGTRITIAGSAKSVRSAKLNCVVGIVKIDNFHTRRDSNQVFPLPTMQIFRKSCEVRTTQTNYRIYRSSGLRGSYGDITAVTVPYNVDLRIRIFFSYLLEFLCQLTACGDNTIRTPAAAPPKNMMPSGSAKCVLA